MNISVKEFKAMSAKRQKYNARTTHVDGIRFDSMREAKRYEELKILQKAGEVLFINRQAVFDLPGAVKYKIDFVVYWADGRVTFEDTKGFKPAMFNLKKKQVEALYPIEILEI